MNNLQQFLLENPVDNVTQEIVLSGRLKDFKFKVRAITGKEYSDYQARCIENPNSPKKRKFNTQKFNELIVVNHTVDPNFKDAEWLKTAGILSMDAAQLLYKTLLAGEINELADTILKISGFNNDTEELIEEAKN